MINARVGELPQELDEPNMPAPAIQLALDMSSPSGRPTWPTSKGRSSASCTRRRRFSRARACSSATPTGTRC
jgi:hypothetical protein